MAEKKRKNGGKRPGAGRPKGAKNKKTTEVIAKATSQGVMPLDVMLHNMRKAHGAAEEIEKKIAAGDAEAVARKDELLLLRGEAETCAKDAAPYLHPRLSSIEHKTKPYDLSQLTEKQIDELERILRFADARGANGREAPPGGTGAAPGTRRVH